MDTNVQLYAIELVNEGQVTVFDTTQSYEEAEHFAIKLVRLIDNDPENRLEVVLRDTSTGETLRVWTPLEVH